MKKRYVLSHVISVQYVYPIQGSATFDFNGTGPEVKGNCNAPRAVTLSALIYCLRCMVGHNVPLNQVCVCVCVHAHACVCVSWRNDAMSLSVTKKLLLCCLFRSLLQDPILCMQINSSVCSMSNYAAKLNNKIMGTNYTLPK